VTCRLLALVLVVALTLLIASAWAQQPTKIPAVDVLVTHAAASDSTSATRKYQPHPWMAGFGCGFNRSMQQFGGIVRRVFRSLEFFLGADSISLPLR